MKAVLQLPAVVVVPVLAATAKVFCWFCGLYIIDGGGYGGGGDGGGGYGGGGYGGDDANATHT